MDDFKPELLKALLDWVNTFKLTTRVSQWTQLEDGQILWQILADIDPEYFSESLPHFDETNRRGSELWIPRWQNLKHIERAVSTYIREECGQLPVLSKRMIPEMKTAARDGSTMLTAKLTMAVLLAACYSPKTNQRMVEVMIQLGPKTAETIAAGIQEMQALDMRMADLGVDQELTPDPSGAEFRKAGSRAVSMERDAGLEAEAQLIEANKERAHLKSQVSMLREQLQNSQEKVSTLEEQLIEAKLHLDVGAGRKQPSDELEQLQAEVVRERQYISDLELELAASKDQLAQAERQLERLKADSESKQDLRDNLQLVKAERDELAQKVKANENLKKKIQTMSQEVKTLENLRQEHQTFRERIQELEPLEERVQALEKANRENAQTIVQCETSIFEEKGKRTRVEHENHLLLKQLEQTRELQARAEEARRELEQRLRELEASEHVRGSSLEDELGQEETDDHATSKHLLESHVTSDTILLKQKLEIMEARVKSLEAECLKQMTENLGLRADLMSGDDEEKQRPFLEQNQKLQAVEAKLHDLQINLRKKEVENAEMRNELIKHADGTEDQKAGGAQAENDCLVAQNRGLLSKLQDLELQHDEKASLLRTALLRRENLPPGLKELRRADTLKRIREQLEHVASSTSEDRPKVIETTAAALSEEIEAAQLAAKTASNELQEQREANEVLQAEIEKIKSEGSKQGNEELQKELQNLRRENNLMTTAWYDMACRLQSNTVVLQRRNEAPKSWLGRQRVVVGGNGSSTRR